MSIEGNLKVSLNWEISLAVANAKSADLTLLWTLNFPSRYTGTYSLFAL